MPEFIAEQPDGTWKVVRRVAATNVAGELAVGLWPGVVITGATKFTNLSGDVKLNLEKATINGDTTRLRSGPLLTVLANGTATKTEVH